MSVSRAKLNSILPWKQSNRATGDYLITKSKKMAMENFGKDWFSKIYYETKNENIQNGMGSYSKERMCIQSAFRRGFDSKEAIKENEAFFTLEKYA